VRGCGVVPVALVVDHLALGLDARVLADGGCRWYDFSGGGFRAFVALACAPRITVMTTFSNCEARRAAVSGGPSAAGPRRIVNAADPFWHAR